LDIDDIILDYEKEIEEKLMNFEFKTKIDKIYSKAKQDKICNNCKFNKICYKKESKEIVYQEYINIQELSKWFSTFKKPIYYLDFESYSPPYPRFKDEHPYSNYVFLYSVIKEDEHEVLTYEYIVPDNSNDYRKELFTNLINSLGEEGTIFVYNETFEKNRIREAIITYPELEKELLKINERIVDLLKVIKNTNTKDYQTNNYYNTIQEGSYSLKNVIKAFDKNMYRSLEINNGRLASMIFANLNRMSNEEKEKAKNQLIQYCKKDTESMKIIIDSIRKRLN
jgi:hypothetical protein